MGVGREQPRVSCTSEMQPSGSVAAPGAGSESGNELPLSGVGLAGRLGLGWGEVASHSRASSEASRLPLNFPSCSQRRGGDESAPLKERLALSHRPFASQLVPAVTRAPPPEDPWNVSTGGRSLSCMSRGQRRQIMGLNERGLSSSLHPLCLGVDGTDVATPGIDERYGF